MRRMLLSVFIGLVFIVAGSSAAFALQAGGVEIGDLETGSVVGQPFKELVVDQELFAIEIGNMKAWYPPAMIIDFKSRPGRPFVIKVTSNIYIPCPHCDTQIPVRLRGKPDVIDEKMVDERLF